MLSCASDKGKLFAKNFSKNRNPDDSANLDSSKVSCFPDCWMLSSVVPVCKNVGESSITKNYRPVSLLSVVNSAGEPLKSL